MNGRALSPDRAAAGRDILGSRGRDYVVVTFKGGSADGRECRGASGDDQITLGRDGYRIGGGNGAANTIRFGVVAFVGLILTACVSPQTAIKAQCLPLVAYTPAEDTAAAAAIHALSGDNPLIEYMLDYGRMRDADRACIAASTPSK